MAKVSFSVQDLLGLADQQQTAPTHLSPEARTAGVPAASVVPHAAFCGNCSAAPPPGRARTRSRAGDAGEQQAGPVEHVHRHGHPAPNSARCHQPARDSTGRTPSPSADDRHSSASGSEAEEEEETRTKRARTAYTRQQLQMMELSFRTCPYPDSHSRKEIAKRLGITEGKVQVWFQNRRAKYRKRQRPFQKALTLPQTVPSLPPCGPTTSSPSPTYPHLRPSPYSLPFPSYSGLKTSLPFTPSLPLPPYPHLPFPFPYPPLTNYTSTFPIAPPSNTHTSIALPKYH